MTLCLIDDTVPDGLTAAQDFNKSTGQLLLSDVDKLKEKSEFGPYPGNREDMIRSYDLLYLKLNPTHVVPGLSMEFR